MVEQTQATVNELTAITVGLNEKLQLLGTEEGQLKELQAELQQKVDGLYQSGSKEYETMERMQQLQMTLQTNITQTKATNEDLMKSNGALEDVLAGLTEDVRKATEYSQTKQEEIARLTSEKFSLLDLIRSNENVEIELREEARVANLKTNGLGEQLAELQKQTAMYQSQNKEHEHLIEKLTRERNTLQQAAEDLQTQITQLQEDTQASNTIVETRLREKAELVESSHIEKHARMELEAEMEGQLQAMTQEIDALSQSLATQQEQNSKTAQLLASMKNEHEALQESTAELEAEKQNLLSATQTLQESHESLRQVVARSSSEVHQLKGPVERLAQEKEYLVTQKAEMGEKFANTLKDLEMLRQEKEQRDAAQDEYLRLLEEKYSLDQTAQETLQSVSLGAQMAVQNSPSKVSNKDTLGVQKFHKALNDAQSALANMVFKELEAKASLRPQQGSAVTSHHGQSDEHGTTDESKEYSSADFVQQPTEGPNAGVDPEREQKILNDLSDLDIYLQATKLRYEKAKIEHYLVVTSPERSTRTSRLESDLSPSTISRLSNAF
eukprot:GILK01017388.1.p1 GENE.GILK01017388.1~~GILK01017388.1.p1  ORF type:complete len:623 (-),score=145.28 GILK01017388.1:78-1742(-)